MTNSSGVTDSSSHSLGEVTSEDLPKDAIPAGPVERTQSRNIKQNWEQRQQEAHLRGDAIQLERQHDERKSKKGTFLNLKPLAFMTQLLEPVFGSFDSFLKFLN